MAKNTPTSSWRHVLLLGYLALIAGCSLEIVPGWEILELGWSTARFYMILAASGLLVGGLMTERYWLPGLIAGPVIGMGGLTAVAWHLGLVPATNSVFVFILALVGTIPGWAIYTALRLVQMHVTSPATGETGVASQSLRAAR